MKLSLLPLFFSCLLGAQALDQVIERLNRLEKENETLRQEVNDLKKEVSALRGTTVPVDTSVVNIDERLQVAERRVDEQAHTKVEAAQRFPVKLSGMVLANLYHNGPHSGGNDHPVSSARARGRQTGGITFRQSIVGFQYTGGNTVLGGRVKGSLFLDFYEGPLENTPLYPVRVRTGGVELEWKSRTLSFVQDKPLFSPRDPDSFSYSGVSPLTGAGNLWRWHPQVRFEQRFGGEGDTTARAQIAMYQTQEDIGFNFVPALGFERRRPSLQGRFELAHRFGEQGRIEIAPGFHASNSRVNGRGYGSNLVSVDWLVAPVSKVQFSGLFWKGENIHHFGSLRQSFRFENGVLTTVHSTGGWAQLAFPFTGRVSLNLFGGVHDDRNSDLLRANVAANRTGAANLMFRLAPNVILSIEALQNRTTYRDTGTQKNNRYDLSIAYLF
jgi:uncharacterized protein (UPF0335 family)